MASVTPVRRRVGANTAGTRQTAQPLPYVLSGEDVAAQVLRRVLERVIERSGGARGPRLEEVALETLYAEHQRLEHSEPDPRTPSDREFVAWLRRSLHATDATDARETVLAIVQRYVTEISGHFDLYVYRFATSVVPKALSVLLHGFSLSSPRAFDVDDRILVEGEAEMLRRLTQLGTVILAPTHLSNLDSLVLGSILHRMGLPPFAYGAGLNLFSNAWLSFFMHHLGVYTVDRKKTDPLYREVLKEYVTVLLERGQHSLFFPGGTRSRSGAPEHQLKKGLLGTAPVAFRRALAARARLPKIFVVPCVLSYPLVLEARSLIDEFLRNEGGPRYLDTRDEFDNPRRWYDFMRGLRRLDLRVHVRFSQPLDWLGNSVDAEGLSYDERGRPVDPAHYLLARGQLVEDDARDAEYTRLLADRIASAFRRDTVALPTHVVAFTVFERLRRAQPQPNLFRFLRSLGPELSVSVAEALADLSRAFDELACLEAAGKIRRSDELRRFTPSEALAQALATFATYHDVPVVERRGEHLHVRDGGLLLYYRNRLTGYGLLDTDCEAGAHLGQGVVA